MEIRSYYWSFQSQSLQSGIPSFRYDMKKDSTSKVTAEFFDILKHMLSSNNNIPMDDSLLVKLKLLKDSDNDIKIGHPGDHSARQILEFNKKSYILSIPERTRTIEKALENLCLPSSLIGKYLKMFIFATPNFCDTTQFFAQCAQRSALNFAQVRLQYYLNSSEMFAKRVYMLRRTL